MTFNSVARGVKLHGLNAWSHWCRERNQLSAVRNASLCWYALLKGSHDYLGRLQVNLQRERERERLKILAFRTVIRKRNTAAAPSATYRSVISHLYRYCASAPVLPTTRYQFIAEMFRWLCNLNLTTATISNIEAIKLNHQYKSQCFHSL